MRSLLHSMRRPLHVQTSSALPAQTSYPITPFIEANFPSSLCAWSLERTFGLKLFPYFLSFDEEEALARDSRAFLSKQPFEGGHWDAVITDYREIQRETSALPSNLAQVGIRRAQQEFPQGTKLMPTFHALELKPTGEISSHVDSVKFSGGLVAGLCLLSSAVMQLTPDVNAVEEGRAPTAAAAALHTKSTPCITVHLPPRTLYILTGEARYGWGHAIPKGTHSVNGTVVKRDSPRLSVMLRDALPNVLS